MVFPATVAPYPGLSNRSTMRPVPELVTGIRAGVIRRKIKFLIFREALSFFRNPLIAWREMRRVRKLRGKAHGASYVRKYVHSGGRWFWNTDYAGFPSEALRAMIRLEYERALPVLQPPSGTPLRLQTLIWGITNRCPLSCVHCYEWDNLDTREKLTQEELLKILSLFRASGLRHLQFSGGEPLVRFQELVTLVAEASPGMDCWLLTSGFGLTREKADILAAAGLTGAQVSLDHWDEAKHNAFRNHPESYRWVREAVRNCREAGLAVSLSLCATRDFVTPENLAIYAETAREMGAGFVRVLEPRATGRFAHADVRLTSDQIKLLSDFTLQVNNDSRCRDFPIFAFFGYHQRLLGCFGAGNRYLYVDPAGDVHACPFCRGARGNMLKEPFAEIAARVRACGCHKFRTRLQTEPA